MLGIELTVPAGWSAATYFYAIWPAEGRETGAPRPGCETSNIQYLATADAAAAEATLLGVLNGG